MNEPLIPYIVKTDFDKLLFATDLIKKQQVIINKLNDELNEIKAIASELLSKDDFRRRYLTFKEENIYLKKKVKAQNRTIEQLILKCNGKS